MNGFLHDLRFGLRQLVKRPGFAAAAILTLALGIGANTAVFSVLSGYLLKPLPYPHSERLVQIGEHYKINDANALPALLSIPNYLSIKRDTHAFSSIGAYTWSNYVLRAGGQTQRVEALSATASLFEVFKVKPYLGHLFEASAQQPGRGQVAVLSYRLWQHVFGGDPGVIGRTVRLDGKPYNIIAVMPKGFSGFDAYSPAVDLWTPFVFTAKMKSESYRRRQVASVLARLKPGANLQQARAQVDTVLHRLADANGAMQQATQSGMKWQVRSYRNTLVGDQNATLYLLQAAVLLVLSIACVNVANLLLARILGRGHELAMRSALGASRGRLARQLLVEGFCLAIPGGLAGVALGWYALAFIRQLGLGARSELFNVSPDWRVAMFALAVVLAVTIVISLLPIRHFSRIDLQSLLQGGGHTMSGGRGARQVRNALVIVEMALATGLLAGSGLLLHSFVRVQAVDPGFRVNHVLTAHVISASGHADKAAAALFGTLLQRVRRLPGVENAGLARMLPMDYHHDGGYRVAGRPDLDSLNAYWNIAGHHYFKTLGLHLMRGRLFRPQVASGRGTGPIIIDRTLARKAFPNENPIGHTLLIGGNNKFSIVGVVSNIHATNLTKPNGKGTIYFDLQQMPAGFAGRLNLVVKTRRAPYSQIKPVRALVHDINPAASIYSFQSMHDIIAGQLQRRQSVMILVIAFGAIALALAIVGMYGMMSYAVGQRRAECGIRLALGAEPGDILWLIIKDGLTLLGIGLVAGLLLAVIFGFVLSSQLFGIAPYDPFTLIGTAVVLSGITLAACYLPARRAAKLDPAIAIMEQ
jgi:predicted permease